MDDVSQGIPFKINDLQEGERYIKKGQTLFPCPSSVSISNIINLPPDEEVVTMLAKPMARLVLEYDFSIVTKSGFGVQPAEAEATRLVSKYTSVPVPKLYHANFKTEYNGFI